MARMTLSEDATPSAVPTSRRLPTGLALVVIVLIAAYLRFVGLYTWDEPSVRLHPDERFFTDVASTLQVPTDFGEYLDSARNPLNPRNYSKSPWYVYGLLPQTITQLTAVSLTPNNALAPCINRPDAIALDVSVGKPCGDPTVADYQTKIANNDLAFPKLLPLQLVLNSEGRDLTQYYEIYKVGRTWSVLFDLGSVVLAFLIGLRLYGRRVGLLAALLLALSVLPIQLAHFFTVDAATSFFVLLAIYCGVRCAQNGGWLNFAILGLAIGAAMACRVTLATLGLVGVFAVLSQIWRTGPEREKGRNGEAELTISPSPFLPFSLSPPLVASLFGMLALAGVLSIMSFRLLQPDAFQGKNFFDLRPEPRFVENIQRIGLYISGEADMPPNQQWAARVPFQFPLQNMILWGLGLPFGVAAWAAWAASGWQLLRRGRLVHLIPWGWVTFYMAWQGGQFVTTMRYYSSLYGLLAILAAWGLIRIYDLRFAIYDLRSQFGNNRKSKIVNRTLLYLVPLITVVAGTALWAYGFTRIYTHPHSRIMASRWIYQNIPAGSNITSEEWDDGLPIGLDGHDYNQYNGVVMKPYAEDERNKYFTYTDANGLEQPGLLDNLDQADYLIFSSNRVYDSTKRLPMKYPALTRYWNALFEGKLGFKLIADIHSYPTLFGIEIPTPVLAEEAFSVYDHPRVLIFQKTPAYSRANAEKLITDGIAWDEVYKVSSFVGGKVPTALRLTENQWPGYHDGGASILPSLVGSLAPWLAWLVALELIGLAAFAVLFHVLPFLPDRGFTLSKTLGLLIVAWLAWLLASIGASSGRPLMSFSPGSLWLCAAVLIVPGAVVAWRSRSRLLAFWRERRAALLTAEGLFLLAFFTFLVIRAINPDLWHPARGGEKPMDLAFLTATLRSAAFPPYDPWFAGGYINYYYFGFVFVGALAHLSGVAPTVAYNLAVPTIFALTAFGAFGVGYNLLARRWTVDSGRHKADSRIIPTVRRSPSAVRRRERMALAVGLAAALFVTTLGPLTQAAWFLPGSADTSDTTLSDECRAKPNYAEQQSCRGRDEWAFWDATRSVGMAISKQTGGYDGTINEFPFFTFLFGDLHAHMIALPLALAALGLTVAMVRHKEQRTKHKEQRVKSFGSWFSVLCSLFLLALTTGALSATNTWDYPAYLGLGLLTLGLVAWRRWQVGAPLLREMLIWLGSGIVLVVLTRLLFLPFFRSFATDYAGFELWTGERTPAIEFLKINGVWLFLLLSGVLAYYQRRGASLVTLGLVGAAALAISGAIALRGMPALVLIVPMLGLAVGVLLDILFRQRRPGEPLPHWSSVLPALWACAAIGLCFVTELLVAKGDIGRMNTVFKLGMESWTLFALASAASLVSIFAPQTMLRTRSDKKASHTFPLFAFSAVRIAAVLLILAALVYPITATPARLADRFDTQIGPTLDGVAYMHSANAHWNENGRDFSFAEDADALDWMRHTISGTPIVLEAQTEGYRWGGRVSIYTGLPTLLGWPWHETQQRSATRVQPVLDSRKNLVQQLYDSADANETLAKLRQYGVEYVYLGQLEQALYDPNGLAKFDQMVGAGQLEKVYTAGQTRIYHVKDTQNPPALLTTSLPVVAPSLPPEKTAMLDRPVGMLSEVNEYAWNGLAQSQPVAIMLWLLAWLAFGAFGLPVAVLVFGRWRDGGLTFAPLIGLLLLGYAVWLPVSAGLWQYNLLGIAFGVVLVLALNIGALWLYWRTASANGSSDSVAATPLRLLVAHVRLHRRQAAIVGGLWLGAFLVMACIRALNPDLWQPSWGGEKPFEFGFLNAVLRSPVMPPYNPFYSDGTINYYYYGFFLVSLPIKITGMAPAVGFNLALATLFALTVTAAWTIVRQLTGRIGFGLVGALFVAVVGNLAAVFHTPGSSAAGIGPLVKAIDAGGTNLGARLGDWFIGPSRVIPFTINEFPFWSFLFADLHPHLIALPVTLLAIALAYSWMVDGGRRTAAAPTAARTPSTIHLVLSALTLGTLGVTNSWDFPTYALLLVVALVGAVWLDRKRAGKALAGRLLGAVALAGVTAGGGLLLYLPFFQNFKAMVGGVGWVSRGATQPEAYAVIYGLFLLVLLPALALALLRVANLQTPQTIREAVPRRALGIVARPFVSAQVLPLLMVVVVAATLLMAAVLPQTAMALKLAQIAALVGCVVLLVNRKLKPAIWFAFALVALGFAVSIGVDTVFIVDHLTGDKLNPGDYYRMNTVFKFGVQIWVLFALAAATLLPVMLRGLRRLHPAVAGIAALIIAAVAVLSLVYPVFGTISRVAYRFPETPGPTLDGLAFLDTAAYQWEGNTIDLHDDGEAIRWLNTNVQGTPVVLQSSMEFYRAYGVRVAANTGLPTVVSPLHESEQRDSSLVAARDTDVIDFYRTTDPDSALRILSKYRVGYVYLGPIERAAYGEEGMAKFSQLEGSYLTPVFQNTSVTIYKVSEGVYGLPASGSINVLTPQPRPVQPAQPADNGDTANPAGQPTLADLEAQYAADPTSAGTAFALGGRYRDLGRLNDAAGVLATAAVAHPDDVPLHHLWGDVLRDNGLFDDAAKAYAQAAQAQPTASNYNKLGSELLHIGKPNDAEAALAQAIQLDPGAAEPYFHLGTLYEQQGKRDQAIENYKHFLELTPAGDLSEQARAALGRLQ